MEIFYLLAGQDVHEFVASYAVVFIAYLYLITTVYSEVI